jgi:Phage tail protein (Tail_P2_I)
MSTPSTYLRYLPAIYGGADAAFLGEYLKIFEKLLSGIEDANLGGRRGIQELLSADIIGNLFYPRLSFLFDPDDTQFIPPISDAKPATKQAILDNLNSYLGVPAPQSALAGHVAGNSSSDNSQDAVQAWLNGFLNWLGGWVDLVQDNSWNIDKKRKVTAQILALYRLRGTPQGLGFMINLLLELPMKITGVQYQIGQGGLPASKVPVDGEISVTVSNPMPPCITASSAVSKAFILQERYRAPSQVVAGYFPWLFNVLITLPNAANSDFVLTSDNCRQILLLQQQLQQLLTLIKPAASRFVIQILPSMELQAVTPKTQICNAATLGANTLLGLPGKVQ